MKPDTISTIREALELACEFVSETDEGDFDGLEIDGEWITAASVLARLDAAKVAIADLTTQAEPPAMPQGGAQWVPVAEYAYTEHLNMGPGKPSKWQRVEVRGRMITIDRDDTGMHAALLPEGMGVCRLTPASSAPEGVTPARLRAALRTLVDLHAVGDESAARDVVRAWLAAHHPTP